MKLPLPAILLSIASSFYSTGYAAADLTRLSTAPKQCWKDTERYKPTDVQTCKPLLDRLKTFQPFNVKQRFEEGKYPKKPTIPPFLFRVVASTCEFELSAGGTAAVDNFSWRDVRDKITEIVEDCQPPRGLGVGGWDWVGPQKTWFIILRGVIPDPQLPEVGEVFDEVSLDEATIIDPLGRRPVNEVQTF